MEPRGHLTSSCEKWLDWTWTLVRLLAEDAMTADRSRVIMKAKEFMASLETRFSCSRDKRVKCKVGLESRAFT